MSKWHKFLLACNLLLILCTLLGALAPSVNPSTFTAIAYFGLAFPYLILLNLFFLLYWFSQKKWFLVLPILTFFICQNQVSDSIATSKWGSILSSDNEVRVMSYNVRNFDLYNWTENKTSRDEMLEIIKNDQPDVLCFQEFFTMEKEGFENIQLVQQMGYPYYHFEKTLTVKGNQHWGLATFSKFPIDKTRKIDFNNTKNNLVLQTDINVNGNLLSIYNTHLQSLHFDNKDYALFDQKNEETVNSALSVFKKLHRGFNKRSSQAEQLAGEIASAEHPVILCGDFNDVPVSYTYQTVSAELKDAYLENGFGLGGTYAGNLPIILRIDYLFVDPDMSVKDFDVIHQGNSDHYPISALIAF